VATFRKRGDSWRAEVCVGSVRDSATRLTKAAAKAWADEREAELASGATGEHTLRKAFEDYADRVSPGKRGGRWEQIRLAALPALTDFVDRPMSKITPDDWGRWRDKRLESVTPQTVARELTLISAVYEAARIEWRWVRHNPLRDIRWPVKPPPRKRRVPDADRDTIVTALGYRGGPPTRPSHEVAIAFLLALETAMRAGEMMTLAPGQVRYAERFVHLDKTKNGDSRDVPLSTEAIRLLKLLPAKGGRMFSIDGRTLDALFRKARDRTDLVDLHFHDTRREATTRLAKKLDVMELASVTGHRDLRTLHRVYYSPDATEIAGKLD
jgi:integrase